MQLKKILVALTYVLIKNGNALKIRGEVQIEEGLNAQSKVGASGSTSVAITNSLAAV